MFPDGCEQFLDEASDSTWFADAMLMMASYYVCCHDKNPSPDKIAKFCSRINCPFLAAVEAPDGRDANEGMAHKKPRR